MTGTALRSPAVLAVLSLCFFPSAVATHAQSGRDALPAGFENPPESARPRVWWHWMNGNITREGIRLDLEWMHRVGLGGFQNFDADLGTPQVVEERLAFMTPAWKSAFLYATTLADRLGLEEAIAGSPGWSETGGPWVAPAQGMKKFVWSETRIDGGKPFSGVLPPPPSITGPFQNVPWRDSIASMRGRKLPTPPQYYADAAVVAYRAPAGDVPAMDLNPKVTASGGAIDPAILGDGDLVKTTDLPVAPVGEKAWIQYEFSAPATIDAVTLATVNDDSGRFFRIPRDTGTAIEAGSDGREFHEIAAIPRGGTPEHTVAFPAVAARFFRVTFATEPPEPGGPAGGAAPPPAPTAYHISELRLHTGAMVNRFEEKAAFAPLPDLYSLATPPAALGTAIAQSSVVDLTTKMQPDGRLDWTPPPGRWVVLRLGYSLLGITNHPASPEATGLEVDKLDRAAVRAYLTTYLDMYQSAVGSLMGKRGLQYVITDSWEAGAQNWTGDILAEFERRRGYNPIPRLPVLTGHVVGSAEESDQFLWDFRKTIADLTADYHYGEIEALLRARGMGHYGESHESGRAFIADGMEVKKLDDVPMGAMWTQSPGVNKELYGYDADIRESASVAHIYGQNLAAAESMTAARDPWAWSPETLKPTADKELAMGLNRFVIHCSVHQPLVGKAPGLTLGPYGQWFTRNETWAEEAAPWISYLARSSYLLQQGRFAADILYFYGEDSNVTAIFARKLPPVPAGYNFDFVNADALLHEMSARGGRIVTPSGMNYRVLALDPNSEHMSLPVLLKIRDLVQAGAVVVGDKPTDTPSLADNQAQFHSVADALWGSGTGVHSYGEGKVYAGQTLAEALPAMQLDPDFSYTPLPQDAGILFVHRKLGQGDIYYVDNRNPHAVAVDAVFRVDGRSAELWRAESGKREPAAYRIADGRTTVPLRLDSYGTVFVVFRRPAAAVSRTLPQPVETSLGRLDGPWSVSFQPDRGAPARADFARLTSWSDNPDTGIRYFSGTAAYSKTIDAPASWFHPGAQIWMDLGDVKNLAEVTVNGKSLGILWKPPFKADLSSALKPGRNSLSIRVTNLWVNRLIGDQQPNAVKKYSFTVVHPYRADSPLLPSGLLGPVTLSSVSMEAGP